MIQGAGMNEPGGKR